jgi:hypothetical protein
MIPITASARNSGVASIATAGNSGIAKRRKPYVPIFSITPARITEPAVGASVCASGSQVCTGHIGTLIANASAKPANSQRASVGVSAVLYRVGRSKVRVPVCSR